VFSDERIAPSTEDIVNSAPLLQDTVTQQLSICKEYTTHGEILRPSSPLSRYEKALLISPF
jgi:hypothetical protein